MGRIGLPELLVIFLILVVLFGSSKIPQLGRGLGEGIKNFKKGLKGDDDQDAPGGDTSQKPR
jgi:sec-independent protein translocase protein TatA